MTRRVVLVADDNEASRELVREILDGTGLEIIEAPDGQHALELIRVRRPDLVLLDIQMPGAGGYDVIRALRGDPELHGVRVVALTAYAMPADRDKALAAGFDGYLAKPVDPDTLRREVRRMFGSRAAACR